MGDNATFNLIISILTTVIAVMSLQGKKMTFILICQLVSNALVVLQYSLAEAFSGAWICSLAVVQLLIIYIMRRCGKDFPLYLTVAFIIGYVAISIVNYTAPYDLLSGAAACCFALSVGQKHPAVCRAILLVNSILWLIFCICSRAYGTIPVYATLIVMGIVSMVRLDRGFWRSVLTGKKEEK